MKQPAERKRAAARRFVHLGDRLLAIGRVRAGAVSLEDAAKECGVDVDEVLHWMRVHHAERNVTFEELRDQCSPETARLTRRVQRLVDLVADAERLLRDLHQEFTSKQFGENPHLPALRVVHAQPRAE